ncbi:MAG: diguanylate cyclase [Erysipelotrichaceae bacterium]
MIQKVDLLDFVESFHQAYFILKDKDAVLNACSPYVLWSGIFNNTIYYHINEVEAMLMDRSDIYEHDFMIKDRSYGVESIKEDIFLINTCLTLNDTVLDHEINMYSSLIVENKLDHLQIDQVHFSIMNSETLLLKDAVIKQTNRLAKALLDLSTLTNNVPGGIFRCRYDETLTILSVSEGFEELFGYTEEEIKTKYHNSFKEMIDERDVEATNLEVIRQLKISPKKNIEYRIKNKKGETRWICDRGQLIDESDGNQSFYCILIDITADKAVQEELRLNLERHQIIMDQSNDVIFDWDIKKDLIVFSLNWVKKFHYKYRVHDALTLFKEDEQNPVYQEDRKIVNAIFDDMKRGEAYFNCEVRVLKDDHYIWCQVRGTTQFNDAQEAIRIVGVIIDIDDNKRMSQLLLRKSQQDSLTGILNKISAQSMIKESLEHNAVQDHSALLIIDIDDFKLVNDGLGHLFGDAVLVEVANSLHDMLDKEDIIGRIGGDEFLVFLKSYQSFAEVEKLANSIIDLIRNLRFGFDQFITISCSVGISLAPQDGRTFKELYQKGDNALYQAKHLGKNRYVLYNEQFFNEITCGNHNQLASLIRSQIESDHSLENNDHMLIETIFKVLYQASDIYTAVEIILKLVGEKYDVSRTYIFEKKDNFGYMNTFEWCQEGIKPKIKELKYEPIQDPNGNIYADLFNEEGIFYCRDFSKLNYDSEQRKVNREIKAVLQCAIMEHGVLKGFVGFDECRENRYWTQEQINALTFISRVLSTFLLKTRIQEQLIQESEGLLKILNNQMSLVYIIEKGTYRILFLNKKLKEFEESAKSGVKCYKAFMNYDHPCPNCPLNQLSNQNDNATNEVWNVKKQVWGLVNATSILWENQDAYLISIIEITNYKKN